MSEHTEAYVRLFTNIYRSEKQYARYEVTEEDSKMNWQVGQEIRWMQQHRGGYGYVSNIKAYVVKIGPCKIGIAVLRIKTGEWVPKWVSPLSLREVQ